MNLWPFIEVEEAEQHSVNRACELLEVSRAAGGRYLGYVSVVGRRRPGVRLEQLPQSVPVEYTKTPLLRRQDGQPQEAAQG